MARSKNTRLLAHIDCPGGGQVWVDGRTLYIGHMREPTGTTIVDIADPARPVVIGRVEVPPGWHSHKVRVANGLMVVNHERQGQGGDPAFGGGLGIYDISTPSRPELLCKWRTHGKGVHRYDFDGRYAYISPTAEGYIGNIMMILDLKDPRHPEEVGRWWIPGQLLASRLSHSRHLRHVEAEAHCERQHLARISTSDAHLPAHSPDAEGPQGDGGGR
jgi:hypothetical protein